MDQEAFTSVSKDPNKWFKYDNSIFQSALRAINGMLPPDKRNGIEVTCEASFFSQVLGIRNCNTRWLSTHKFNLPFENLCGLDYIVVSFCHDSPVNLSGIFKKAYRLLKPRGILVVAFVDSKNPASESYICGESKHSDCDTEKVIIELARAGFQHFEFRQTLFSAADKITETQIPKDGYGEGAFVVVQAKKKI